MRRHALLDHLVAEPGPQALLAALAADDRAEAGQRLLGVGLPVRVVGVEDVVVAELDRQVRRPEDALDGGVGIVAPVAGRRRAVERDQAGDLMDQRRDPRLDAGVDLLRGHVRNDRVVRVEGPALVVGADRVHPRVALVLRLRLDEVLGALRLVHVQPGVGAADLIVGVAEREHRRVGPTQPDARTGEDRAEARVPERRRFGAPALDGNRDLAARHRRRLAVVDVAGRVGGIELELEQGESLRGRDRVAPGDVAVVTDVDRREAHQARADHVQLAGDLDVEIPEAVDALPREVRIGEDEPVAVLRVLGADAERVRAHPGGVGVVALDVELGAAERLGGLVGR